MPKIISTMLYELIKEAQKHVVVEVLYFIRDIWQDKEQAKKKASSSLFNS